MGSYDSTPPLSSGSTQKLTTSNDPIQNAIDDFQDAMQDNVKQKQILEQLRQQLKEEAEQILADLKSGDPKKAQQAANRALSGLMRMITQKQDQEMGVQTSNQDVVNKLLNINTSLENLKNQATNLIDPAGYTLPPGSYDGARDLSGKTIHSPLTFNSQGWVALDPINANDPSQTQFVDITKPGVLPPGTFIKLADIGSFAIDGQGNVVPSGDINNDSGGLSFQNKVLQMNKNWANGPLKDGINEITSFLNGNINVTQPDGSVVQKKISEVYPFSERPSLIDSFKDEASKLLSNPDPITAWQAGTLYFAGGSEVTDYINKSQSYQSDVTSAISQAKGNLGGFNQAQITQLQAYQALQKSLIDSQKNMIQSMQGFIKNVTQRMQ
jgi:hypothetical protein